MENPGKKKENNKKYQKGLFQIAIKETSASITHPTHQSPLSMDSSRKK